MSRSILIAYLPHGIHMDFRVGLIISSIDYL